LVDDPGNEKVMAWEEGATTTQSATAANAMPLPKRTFFANNIAVVKIVWSKGDETLTQWLVLYYNMLKISIYCSFGTSIG